MRSLKMMGACIVLFVMFALTVCNAAGRAVLDAIP